ncbi:MAG: hypothetical protein J6T24_03525 [Clostridia bacterium]|nr:hypothetical protein [Clostridia bacterium]
MKKRVLSLLLMLVMVLTAVPFFAFSASAETVEEEEAVFDYNSLYVTNGLIYGLDFYSLNEFWGGSATMPASPADSFTGEKVSGNGWSADYKSAISSFQTAVKNKIAEFAYKKTGSIYIGQSLPGYGANSWNDSTGEFQKGSLVFGDGFVTIQHPHNNCYNTIAGLPITGLFTEEVVMATNSAKADGQLITFRDVAIGVNTTGGSTLKVTGITKYAGNEAYTVTDPTAFPIASATPFTMTLTDDRTRDEETANATHTTSLWINGTAVWQDVLTNDPATSATDNKNVNTLFGYGNTLNSNIYAVRVYDRTLTDDERTQNYFADLCKWYKLDMSLYTTLTDTYRATVTEQLLEKAATESIVLGGNDADRITLQTALNNFSSDVVYGELNKQDNSAAAQSFRTLAQSLLADIGGVLGLPVALRAPVYAAALALTTPTRAEFEAAVAEAIDKVIEDNYGDYINSTDLTYKDLYVKQENLVLWADFFAARATDGNLYMEYSYSDAPTTADGSPLPSGYTTNWVLPKYKDGKSNNGLNPDRIFIPQESGEAAARAKYIYRGGDFFTFADIPDAKWGHTNIRTWGDGRLICGLNNSLNVKSPGVDQAQVTYQFVCGWENNDTEKSENMNVQLDGVRAYFVMDAGNQAGYFNFDNYNYYGYGVSTDTYSLSNNALMQTKPGLSSLYVGDSLDITLTLDKQIGADEGHYFIQQYKTNADGAIEYIESPDEVAIALNLSKYARLYRYQIDGAWYYLRVTGSGSTATYEARYAETMAQKPKYIVDADGYRVESVPVTVTNGVMAIDWANAKYVMDGEEKMLDDGSLASAVYGPCYQNPFEEVEFGTPGAVGPINYYGTYDMGVYANGGQFYYVSGLSYQKSDIGWVGNSGNMTFYAVRTYNTVLSEADMRQNHFADLAGFYGLDLSLYALLSDSERLALHDDLRTLELGLAYEDGIAAYEEAIDKYLYNFDTTLEGAEHFLEICHNFGLDTRVMKELSPESLTRIFAEFVDLDPNAANYSPIVQKAVSEVVAAEIDAHYAAAYGHKTISFEGWQLHKEGDFGLRALYTTDLARVRDVEENGGAKVMTGVLVAKYDKNGIASLDDVRVAVDAAGEVTVGEGVTLVKGYWKGEYDAAAADGDTLYIKKDTMIDVSGLSETSEISAVLKNEKYFYRGFTVIVVGEGADQMVSVFYDEATADGKTGAQSIYSLSRVAKKLKMSEVNIQKAMNICDRDSYIAVEVGNQSIDNYQIVISAASAETAKIQSALYKALGFRLNEVRAADAAGKSGFIYIGNFDNLYDENCYGVSIFGGNIYIWYNTNAEASDACALFVEFIERMYEAGETAVFPENVEFVRRLAD